MIFVPSKRRENTNDQKTKPVRFLTGFIFPNKFYQFNLN